jgi:dipeptidyl aminopeptidase/acylaminoacyl peptidase
MRGMRWLAPAAMLACGAGAAHAQDDLAARFGARDNVLDVGISPDGTKLTLIQPLGAHAMVLKTAVMDKEAKLATILTAAGEPERLEGCDWAANDRLVCSVATRTVVAGSPYSASRLVALDVDGGNMKMLSARASARAQGTVLYGGRVLDWLGDDGKTVLMDRWFVPETTIGTHLASSRNGLGVERVDVHSFSRSVVEPPNAIASRYITDGRGTVRVMALAPENNVGRSRDRLDWRYRRKGSRDWLPLNSEAFSGGQSTGFHPLAVDPDLDVVYGLDNVSGRTAVFKVALDGSLKKELVFEQPGADVDQLVRIGRQRRVVGASWIADRRESAMFDPALKKLSAALSRALPGAPLVHVVDASADEQRLVVFAAGDTQPGTFYLLDRASRKMEEIARVRPALGDVKLAPVKWVSYPAADGTMIPAYLTLPVAGSGRNIPAIVMPHGGPWSRDEWGFDWLPQFFAARGYAVLQPQYRGSTGFGTDWYAENGFRSWRTAVGDIADGGRWLATSGVADPAKLAIVGWSYGGYAALQAQVVDPALFKAAVAIAPVTDFGALRTEWGGTSTDASLLATFGDAQTAQEGSPARHAERFAAPVLMFHGTNDENVSVNEARLMASRLKGAGKKAELIEFKALDHQLDDSVARADLLRRSDAFLRASMGM